MYVTCLFEDHGVPLLSTKHVALRTNYSTRIVYHKQSIQRNQTIKQLKCICLTIWFIEMFWQEGYGKRLWFGGYGSESLVGEINMSWERIGLGNYYWWSFYALTKHERGLGRARVK
jgi:hypothetical protein